MTTAEQVLRPSFKYFRWPKLIIARFTAKRSSRSAVIWGYVFGISAASSILGFESLYKTPASRHQLAVSLGNNSGINALLGLPHRIDTVGGFTAWRSLGVAMIIGGIWGLLLATKTFRGEEESGRWEKFLAGQTTSRRAAANALAGVAAAMALLWLMVSVITFAAGQTHSLHFSVTESLFFGTAIIASAVQFAAVGALTSQLAPIRRRAAMYAALVFGVSFLARAIADSDTSLGWLVNLSPLGWVEKLHPLTGAQPIWLVPIAAFTLVTSFLAVYLAGRRDLGDSLLADKDTAKARTRLLHNPLGLSFRLEKNAILGWAAGAGFIGLGYGYIAKTATQIIKDSAGAGKAISKIAGQAQLAGAKTFLGILFLLVMVVVMVQATSLVGAVRSEEAEGYLDNFLVAKISRLRWLAGRLLLVFSALVISVAAGALLGWAGEASQHTGVSFYLMMMAGLNLLPAEVFIAGLGILTLGFKPRLTTTAMYSLIAWSFLMEMIGSSINLNHYILDTSLLHHVALAPAVNPDWTSGAVLAGIGLIMLLLGAARFNNRDLQGE